MRKLQPINLRRLAALSLVATLTQGASMAQQSAVVTAPAATMAHYRAPFLEPAAREPMLRFPNEIPIAGEPIEVYAMVCAYHDWLLQTELPKLMFKASPGALISEERARWYERRLRNA